MIENGKIFVDPQEVRSKSLKEMISDVDKMRDLAQRGLFKEISLENFPFANPLDILGYRLDAVNYQLQSWGERRKKISEIQGITGSSFGHDESLNIKGINTIISFFERMQKDVSEQLSSYIGEL